MLPPLVSTATASVKIVASSTQQIALPLSSATVAVGGGAERLASASQVVVLPTSQATASVRVIANSSRFLTLPTSFATATSGTPPQTAGQLYLGTQPLSELRVGTQLISAVYWGATRIF